MNTIIDTLSKLNLPSEIIVFILSILPVSELRGAIPVGVGIYKLSITKTFLIAIIGNFSFVIPFLLFLNTLHKYFMKISWYRNFFNWWLSKVKTKAKNIEKYEYIGLTLFVGIPLPMTGAWSGCLASYILGLNLWKSTIAIFLGILFAGIIVITSTVGIKEIIMLVAK
ncbi:MAG: small multi-drug export protein [Endomicrobiia bacterium]